MRILNVANKANNSYSAVGLLKAETKRVDKGVKGVIDHVLVDL